MLGRVVDQFRELALTHLVRTIAKHKEESIDNIGFTRSIRADNYAEEYNDSIVSDSSVHLVHHDNFYLH
jgi:hypothetical protein